MKSPSQSQIDKLEENANIFYDFPGFYGNVMEKSLNVSEWEEYHQHMRGYMRQVEKLSSMMFRLIDHLEDWHSSRYNDEERKRARDKAVLGMLIFVPALTDFCVILKSNDGIVGDRVASYFSTYLDTFSSIWNTAVDESAPCPYPAFLPSSGEFEPIIDFFYDFVEEMKTIAEEDFTAYTSGVYMHLFRMNENVGACEKLSLLERQYSEFSFAWKLLKVVPEVKTLRDSLTESGYKNEGLDNLLTILTGIEEKYKTADKFFATSAEKIFGKKFTRLTVKGA